MFEIVQFVEHRPGDQAVQTFLGQSEDFDNAIEIARLGRSSRSRVATTPMPGRSFGNSVHNLPDGSPTITATRSSRST